jgi:hypothetical protein
MDGREVHHENCRMRSSAIRKTRVIQDEDEDTEQDEDNDDNDHEDDAFPPHSDFRRLC